MLEKEIKRYIQQRQKTQNWQQNIFEYNGDSTKSYTGRGNAPSHHFPGFYAFAKHGLIIRQRSAHA